MGKAKGKEKKMMPFKVGNFILLEINIQHWIGE